MVLADLGKRIQRALFSIKNDAAIDEKTLDELLSQVSLALLESDVNSKLVETLQHRVRSTVDLKSCPPGANKRKLIQKVVFDELCNLVDPGIEAFKPKKGGANVVMFVGLQGSGKTTSCAKYAYFYVRKGWRVALICADTFRAGAFDQLRQNAAKIKVPFYGSYSEADPVAIVRDGLAKFRSEPFDLIIIDTSGRHKQESALFEEMQQISAVAKPNSIVLVMDASIGQAADAQAVAFGKAVTIGSIFLTKMDGHAKGGGAISAIAATRSPIVFIGTGEHVHDVEPFTVQSFISRMLGYGDVSGIVETVRELNIDESSAFAKKVEQGIFTLREMKEQFQMILSMGPISRVMSMMPGMSSDMFKGSDHEVARRLKRFLAIMDSMTATELDGDGKVFASQQSRIQRVSFGSGTFPTELVELLSQYRKFAQLVKGLSGKGGLLSQMQGNGTRQSPADMQNMTNQLSRMIPPEMLKQLGGAAGLTNFMRQLEGIEKSEAGESASNTSGSSTSKKTTRK